MNSNSRVDKAPLSGAGDSRPNKSRLLVRTVLFVSIHVAFVGAGVLLYSG